MALVDDDMKEASIDYLLPHSLNANSSHEAVLPADIAWADSCLIEDTGVSNTDWSSMKDALMEILSSHTGPLNSSSSQSSRQPSDEGVLFTEDITTPEFSGRSDEDQYLIFNDKGDVDSIEISEDDEEVILLGDKTIKAKGRNHLENVFRQNYTEDFAKMEELDCGLDMSLTTYLVEPLEENIFKVWDLGFSDGLDDLSKLGEPIADLTPQIESEDSMSIDDLIAGVGHLSLTQHTK